MRYLIVAFNRSESNNGDSRVIRFRPRIGTARGDRRGKTPIGNTEPDYSPVPDLSKYQRTESDDNYRHRMIINAIAFVYISMLILAGVWLANMMAHP